MIKYKISLHITSTPKIKKIEVARETNKSVYLKNGSRALKNTEWECYFNTHEEAKKYFLTFAENKKAIAQSSLDATNKCMESINNLFEG